MKTENKDELETKPNRATCQNKIPNRPAYCFSRQLGGWIAVSLQVEQVIKEQNTLDAFVMIEGYCHLLLDRIELIQEERLVC